MFARVHRCLAWHPLATFLVLMASFAAFSLATYDLFQLFSANADYIARDGIMALAEGGAAQFFGLCGSLVLASLAYLVFKACERILVDRMTGR